MIGICASSFAHGRRVACVLALVLSAAADATSSRAAAATEVGTTVLIQRQVTGKLDNEERRLATGSRVHRNELLKTGPEAQAELKLDDNTKLALGPDAELLLDEYAVGSGTGTTTIALKMLKGALRFLTGENSSESYKIETPSAIIGVQGTIFDIYIGPGGDTFVLLHQGNLKVCSRAGTCRPHVSIGRVIQVTASGSVSEPMKWTAKLVPGVGVAQAFPFVGKRLSIDPVRRLTFGAITGDGRVIDQGGESVEKTLKKSSPSPSRAEDETVWTFTPRLWYTFITAPQLILPSGVPSPSSSSHPTLSHSVVPLMGGSISTRPAGWGGATFSLTAFYGAGSGIFREGFDYVMDGGIDLTRLDIEGVAQFPIGTQGAYWSLGLRYVRATADIGGFGPRGQGVAIAVQHSPSSRM